PARARDDYQQTCHSDERSEEKSAPTGYGFLARGGGLGMTAGAYSADSHIVEPQELFAGLERRYGERAPRIVHDPDWGDFLIAPGVTGREAFSARYAGVPVGRLGIAGARLDDPVTQQQIK